ncbi:Uncharacterised protein [Chlamydia trachomatis]|nr:Uncharacterised protein [Chlamydia trachomatis]
MGRSSGGCRTASAAGGTEQRVSLARVSKQARWQTIPMQAAFCPGFFHRLFVLQLVVFLIRQPAHGFDLRGVVFGRCSLHRACARMVGIDRLSFDHALVDEIVACCCRGDGHANEER